MTTTEHRPVSQYDVVSRPAGGIKIVVAKCTDGRGHIFAYDERMNKLSRSPACKGAARILRPLHDTDNMCDQCATASERWAKGGTLEVE